MNQLTKRGHEPGEDPHAPPVWSRGKMISTFLKISGAMILVALVMFTLLQTDLELAKENQRVERMEKYFRIAQLTIQRTISAEGAPYEPTDENTLPERIAQDFADANGGFPFYQEEGRHARLDMFSPNGPFTQPLFYQTNQQSWILVSRGPDQDFDLPGELDKTDFDESQILHFRYDPSNGAMSSGDLWVSSTEGLNLDLDSEIEDGEAE